MLDMAFKEILRALNKLKYLYSIFIFNHKLQYLNIITILLLLMSFRKLISRYVKNVDNILNVTQRNSSISNFFYFFFDLFK